MYFDSKNITYLSLGAHLLGGGGGGQRARGLKTANEALTIGKVELKELDELSPDDIVVTISGVGAPSKKEAMYTSQHYLRALELLETQLDRPIAGFIPSEMGASAAFGPFIAAAAKGLPVINTACDGRAHPLGTMGALGLDKNPSFETIQAACGGKKENGTYIEILSRGNIRSVSKASLMAAQLAGGLTTVVRNPINAAYLKEHSAVGCYKKAMEIGQAISIANTPMEKANSAMKLLGGTVICEGIISTYELITEGGLDHGRCTVMSKHDEYTLHFYNEYMALEHAGKRIGTFPDLIATIDASTGTPLLTAEIAQGREVIVLLAPKERLILASGIRQPQDYKSIENILGIPMLKYISDIMML